MRPWLIIPCALLVVALAAWDVALIRQAFAPACRVTFHQLDLR